MDYLTSKISENSLYQTEFEDGYVIWRLLPWSVFKKYREAASFLGDKAFISIEEEVYTKCVIHSTFDDDIPDGITEEEIPLFLFDSRLYQEAGIMSTVVKCILKYSGANKPLALMEQLDSYRSTVFDIEEQLLVTICRAFPAYKPEEIEQMDWQTILRRATQAEALLMQREIELPFSLMEDKKKEIPQKKERDPISQKRDMKREYLRQRGF